MHLTSNLTKTLNFVRDFKAGNHGIFFYSSPQEKHEVLFNFLQAGIERGEGAIYVATQETPAQIRRQMQNFGLNVKTLERDGVLRVFECKNWYIIDGKVNMSHTKTLSLRVLNEVMELGLKGLRGCGEAACFFERKKEKEMVKYELQIGRNFDLPVAALCAYDVNHAKSLDEKLFFSLIKAHGLVVTASFAGEMRLEDCFLPIMDEVLKTMFGEMGKKTILKILEGCRSLTPHKIAEDPRSFIEGLEEFIGCGAQVIAKSAVKEMHSKIGILQQE